MKIRLTNSKDSYVIEKACCVSFLYFNLKSVLGKFLLLGKKYVIYTT